MYSTTEVAKKLGMRSSQQLNTLLESLGIQTSFYHAGRKYWQLTPSYQHKGYDAYSSYYAEQVTRPNLLATLHWTDQGVDFLQKVLATVEEWRHYLALEPVSALHCYVNKANRKVIQLTSYNPEEPLDGTRAYIPEGTRQQFVQEVQDSIYRQSKLWWNATQGLTLPTYAVDERDPELLAKWLRWIEIYTKFNVLLNEES